MNHLSPDELVDLADGVSREPLERHLTRCATCRQRLAELRISMGRLAEVGALDVPEPSPLFWDHLPARVEQRVTEAPPAPAPWALPWKAAWWTRHLAVAVGGASLLLAVGVLVDVRAPREVAPGPLLPASPAVAHIGDGFELPPLLEQEVPWALMTELTSGMDWEAARVDVQVRPGSADHVIDHLSDTEREALGRLLEAEIAIVPGL